MRNTQWPLTEYEVEFLLFKPVPAYPPNSSAPKHTHKLKIQMFVLRISYVKGNTRNSTLTEALLLTLKN